MKCERCRGELTQKKLTEHEVGTKINQLVEEGNTIGGLAPHNEPLKNYNMLNFLLSNCYSYYECVKCGWWKFKKVGK